MIAPLVFANSKTSGSPEWWEVPFYFLYMFLIGNKPVVNCDKKLV
jgi:hypothetical protein